MRKFIRHPSDIPLEYTIEEARIHKKNFLKNVSESGLCFRTIDPLYKGVFINVTIPIIAPPFKALGLVVWSRRLHDVYDVGVRFENSVGDFTLRMVEQLCHIEQYKIEVLKKEGRTLSGQEAAKEWIEQNADEFPE